MLPVIASEIESVTVYREGARVVRGARLQSVEGSQIMIANLPLSLDDDSVRIRVREGGAVATNLRVALDVPPSDPTLPPADSEELESLRLAAESLRARLALVERERDLWSTLKLLGRPQGEDGKPPPPSPFAARSALLQMRRAEVERTQELAAEMSRELEQLSHRMARLEDDEERRSSARQVRAHELRKSVLVTLRGGGEASKLELEYLIPGARWAPAYSLRLSRDLERATLSLRAMVAQRSGEDWNGVRLSLSTAEPASFSELPELQSRRIGRRQESAEVRGFRPPPIGSEELFADYDRAFPTKSEAAPAPTPSPGPMVTMSAVASAGESDRPEAFADASSTLVGGVDYGGGVEKELAASAYPPAAPPPPAPMASAPMPGALPPAMPRAEPVARQARKKAAPRPTRHALAEEPAAELSPTATRRAGMGGETIGFGYDDSLLQYGRLRILGPHSPGRGTLQAADLSQLYLDHIPGTRPSAIEIVQAVALASSRARQLAPLPKRHRYAWSDSFDYAYPAESTSDVASDGTFHSLPLGTETAAARPLYVCVPREAPDVFRTVTIDNPLDAPLLAGPVDVYWDEEYLLTSDLETTAPDGSVELGLGVEQGIKVARNTVYDEDTVGLMGGTSELSHEVRIDVANRTAHSVPLEVRERVPVTREGEEDIEVRVKASPEWVPFVPDATAAHEVTLRGGYAWRADLGADDERQFSVRYDIRLPSKYELVGGNRRDR